jgi:lysophospholipase L1-like esterase
MTNHLALSIFLGVSCTGPFVATTIADLIPQSAANVQVMNRTASRGMNVGQAYWSDGADSDKRAPIALVFAEAGKAGPTPYPQNEGDWPGVGVVRVFGFMTQNRQYFWTQRLVNQGAVVFVGDSNIAGWKTLNNDFAPLRVANVGIGGDVSRGLLFRLKEDVIDLTPKAVVILIGINDLTAKEDVFLLVSNLTSILKSLRDYNHSLPIVLCKLPPSNNPMAPVSSRDVLDLNSRLDSLSTSDSKLALLDLYQLLGLPDGSIDRQNFEADQLHISPTGYKKFHNALMPIFRTLGVE